VVTQEGPVRGYRRGDLVKQPECALARILRRRGPGREKGFQLRQHPPGAVAVYAFSHSSIFPSSAAGRRRPAGIVRDVLLM
jgi:hypothetical protein